MPALSPALNLPASFLSQVALHVLGANGEKQREIIAALSPVLQPTLISYGIDNDFRACYWAGQVCEESDQFCTTEEYASGEAYEGRADLGNVEPGDGRLFKGRGLIQLTGRANYKQYGPVLGLDLIADPALAAEPTNALKIACVFWRSKGLSEFADAEDIETITRRINGGLNGLAERQKATDRAFKALGYTVGC